MENERYMIIYKQLCLCQIKSINILTLYLALFRRRDICLPSLLDDDSYNVIQEAVTAALNNLTLNESNGAKTTAIFISKITHKVVKMHVAFEHAFQIKDLEDTVQR